MKYVLVFALLFVAYVVSAQQMLNLGNDNQTISFKEVLFNLGGQTVVENTEYKNGSPYFKENWLHASVILNNNKRYDELQGKLNIMSGEFLYKNQEGAQFVAQAGIKQIEFTDNGDRFLFINSTTLSNEGSKKIWYQQLHSGAVTLYKQLEKNIVESTPFNSATIEKSIKTKEKYFLLKGQMLIPIKKMKDLLEVLNDQPAALQKINKGKQFSEKTLVEIVSYYNSLLQNRSG
jgi:hypothetical protein